MAFPRYYRKRLLLDLFTDGEARKVPEVKPHAGAHDRVQVGRLRHQAKPPARTICKGLGFNAQVLGVTAIKEGEHVHLLSFVGRPMQTLDAIVEPFVCPMISFRREGPERFDVIAQFVCHDDTRFAKAGDQPRKKTLGSFAAAAQGYLADPRSHPPPTTINVSHR